MKSHRHASVQAYGDGKTGGRTVLLSIGTDDFSDFFSRFPDLLSQFEMRVMNEGVGLKQVRTLQSSRALCVDFAL